MRLLEIFFKLQSSTFDVRLAKEMKLNYERLTGNLTTLNAENDNCGICGFADT